VRVDAEVFLYYTAAAVALFFAVLVLANGRTRLNVILAGLLAAEALFQAAFATSGLGEGAWQAGWVAVGLVAIGPMCTFYAWLLRGLDTPLTRPLKRKGVMVALSAYFLIPSALAAMYALPNTLRGVIPPDDLFVSIVGGVSFLNMLVSSLLAFVVAFMAYRRSSAGPSRDRAAAYAAAFGTRDAVYVIAVLANVSTEAIPGATLETVVRFIAILFAIGTMVYVPMLAYGILKSRLFDIDLRIKVGISRGTVAAIGILAILSAGKIVEGYLSRELGWVAGGVAAGTVLFMIPRLNKLGDRVANKALPKVQDTPAYLAFKKLEVYRAAYEAALETGGLTEKDRASLARLREKLGLAQADTDALEAELSSPGAPAAPTAPVAG
jgi:hypothetical protein